MQFTKRQIEALEAAYRGNAHGIRGRRMGGATTRMIERLVQEGFITEEFPRTLTLNGMRALVDIWERRDASSGCIAYMQRAEEMRAALRERFPFSREAREARAAVPA